MRAISGVVQHYAWGDTTAIPGLLGLPVDGKPWAELWWGTHDAGPATLADGTSLHVVAGELPFILKLLAAAEPLSLQTHPDAVQAAAGFARESARGMSLTDPRRIYRDRSAKPELLCALTAFDALSGFRPVEATLDLLDELAADRLAAFLREHGLGPTMAALYRRTLAIDEIVEACAGHSRSEAGLVIELADRYGDDPSVAVTLLLNRVRLAPGQALFLGPGNLHAYLGGVGVEVMGASDNVVRGGMTIKHVDVDELLDVVRCEPLVDPVVEPIEARPGAWRYPTPDAPFELWRYEVDSTHAHTATGRELLTCTGGDAGTIARGHAVFLAPGDTIVFEGPSTVFRVTEALRVG